MATSGIRAIKRFAIGLLITGSLGGCAVYGPPYAAAYDPYYYPGYAYPTYVGPPVSLNLGFGYVDRGDGYRHGHGHYHGGRGWYGRGGGWSHRGGGWGYGRGRR